MIIVETERKSLTSMVDTEHLNYSINVHMKRIKEHLDGEKIMQLFQIMGEHSVKHAGMSFMSNKTMASKLGVHVRTIQRYTKKLESLNVLLKIPTRRKKNNSWTSNTYVILPVITSVVDKLINKGCHEGCHDYMNPSLNPLKQESNNNISNPKYEKVVEYVVNRVNDSIKQGTKIKYLSSYIDRIVRSLEIQAIYDENMRLKQQQKQRQEESSRLAVELGIKKQYKLEDVYFDYLK